jgi:serine/threonine-protein kinase
MLAGQLPFKAREWTDAMYAHIHEPVPYIPIESGVPEAVEHVVRRALEKRPNDRFADAQEMRMALRAAVQAASPELGLSMSGMYSSTNQHMTWHSPTRSSVVVLQPAGSRGWMVAGLAVVAGIGLFLGVWIGLAGGAATSVAAEGAAQIRPATEGAAAIAPAPVPAPAPAAVVPAVVPGAAAVAPEPATVDRAAREEERPRPKVEPDRRAAARPAREPEPPPRSTRSPAPAAPAPAVTPAAAPARPSVNLLEQPATRRLDDNEPKVRRLGE